MKQNLINEVQLLTKAEKTDGQQTHYTIKSASTIFHLRKIRDTFFHGNHAQSNAAFLKRREKTKCTVFRFVRKERRIKIEGSEIQRSSFHIFKPMSKNSRGYWVIRTV